MKTRRQVNLFHLIERVSVSYPTHALVAAGVLGIGGCCCLILGIKDAKTLGRWLRLDDVNRAEEEDKLCLVAGLQNLGNTCFLNVILQALASCASFNQFIHSVIDEEEAKNDDDVNRIQSNMPLTLAIVFLFQELCISHGERMVLSPRKVMLAMEQYIPSFSLTRQQDAEEAFLHLLSSIKEEISGCYVPHYSSLADISTISICRSTIRRREGQSEQEKWQRYLLGPFDGVLCSSLACKSCSSQLSTDFEFFHSLPLSPILDDSETIMKGSSIQDCLKQFTAAELIENYRCNHCWHNKAIKYLSIIEGDETRLEKVKCCVGEFCDCRNLFPREGKLFSNDSSHTMKRLCVARPPKILCIHIQRASVNNRGELVKLQGHVSFPMILDLFPFTQSVVGVATERFDGNICISRIQQHQPLIPHLNHLNMQVDIQMLQTICRTKQKTVLEAVVEDNLERSIYGSSSGKCGASFQRESDTHHSEDYSHPECTRTPSQCSNKNGKICEAAMPRKSCMYQLVSAVKHYGRDGSGHYEVYRRAKDECNKDYYWFRVSDSEVFSVSEEDVVAVEASLLFYERIEASTKSS